MSKIIWVWMKSGAGGDLLGQPQGPHAERRADGRGCRPDEQLRTTALDVCAGLELVLVPHLLEHPHELH